LTEFPVGIVFGDDFVLTAPLKSRKLTFRVLSTALAMATTGCMVGLDYNTPKTPAPAVFGETHRGPTSQPSQDLNLTRWWKTFNDPQLDSLIDRAVKNNPTYLQAEGRVRQARAQLGVEWGTEFPTLSANLSATHSQASRTAGSSVSGGSGLTPSGVARVNGTNYPVVLGSGGGIGRQSTLYEGGFDAGWEVDVFGGNRRAIEAAEDDLEAQVNARRFALVTLTSEVARDYVSLRGFQEQLRLTKSNVKSQQATLELTKSRFNAGLVSDLDVAQAQANVATTAAEEPTFEIEIRQTIHAISILLGEPPMALASELQTDKPIPLVPAEVPVGLPSELLRRRPDVRQAERLLAESTANIGVSVANLFPKFSLTGSVGQESLSFSKAFRDSSSIWSVGPTINWQILDYFQLQSEVRVANAEQVQALYAYKAIVLQSFGDVEDALVAYAQDQVRSRALNDETIANQRAVDLSTQLYERGLGDFLNVLTAEQALFIAQTGLSQSNSNVATDLVQLYKALGGGWDENDEKPFQKFEDPKIPVVLKDESPKMKT
jgi:NodT family efflux transporter outer membrane factor (OMF) lipoprotein